jgi:hypothetical protein
MWSDVETRLHTLYTETVLKLFQPTWLFLGKLCIQKVADRPSISLILLGNVQIRTTYVNMFVTPSIETLASGALLFRQSRKRWRGPRRWQRVQKRPGGAGETA